MIAVMSNDKLQRENAAFSGSGGRSQENASIGFRPAFYDAETLEVFPSCFADGTLAPLHLLDGLPDKVVIRRSADGRVQAVKASIVSGFTLKGEFYTREAAARRASSSTAAAPDTSFLAVVRRPPQAPVQEMRDSHL